jgi:hypothetical protein
MSKSAPYNVIAVYPALAVGLPTGTPLSQANILAIR